ncbi:MAG: LemA family protein [Bacteroidales bacterium]|nr:LemA family protein [Bacteroidales bacterium]
MEDIKLQNYIRTLLQIQEQNKNKPLKLEELKQVAISGGIPEFEWDEMMREADKNADIAQNHFYYQNYQDAFEASILALNMNPYQSKALITASDAALKIYETTNDDDFLVKAEYYAKEILKHSPTEKRAFQILAKIETFEQKEATEKRKKLFVIFGAATALFFVAIIVFYLANKPPKVNSKLKNELIQKQEEALAQWAQVENVMTRRDNVLPQLLALLSDDNQQVNDIITQIDQLRSQLKTADNQQRMEIQLEIQTKIYELTSLVKSSNTSNDDIELLMVQIEGTYNRISVETKRYNEFAQEYNILLKQNADDFSEFEEMPYYQQ